MFKIRGIKPGTIEGPFDWVGTETILEGYGG